jgi:hypothetical protein
MISMGVGAQKLNSFNSIQTKGLTLAVSLVLVVVVVLLSRDGVLAAEPPQLLSAEHPT